MNDTLRKLDEIPVTLVTALAYVTLFVVCKPFEAPVEFHARLDEFGWLTGFDVATGEPWRLLSYAFLHGGVLHLLVNLASLLSLGPLLERSLGSVRFLVLYLVSALGGGLGTCLLYFPGQAVVGGSGALFGMFGCAVAMNMRAGRHLLDFLSFEGPRQLMGTIAINLAIGFFLPFISNTGHLGGLLTGFVVTFLWLRPGSPSPGRRAWRLATTALFAGFLFSSLQPVTRFDWLLYELEAEPTPARQRQLLRAVRRQQAFDTLPPELQVQIRQSLDALGG